MRKAGTIYIKVISISLLLFALLSLKSQDYVAGHLVAKEEVLRAIPEQYINKAREELVIAFQHTSHGTHVSRGMYGLPDYKSGDNTLFAISRFNKEAGKLFFRDEPLEQYPPGAKDLSDGETTFAETTRNFLDAGENADVNVVMWAWCEIWDHDVAGNYLPDMETLIGEYGPGGSKIGTGDGQREHPVTFIFMTGHATANANVGEGRPKNQAQLITDHCKANGRLCLDYYSIDTHDMDDNYWEDAGENGNSESYGGNFYQDFQDANAVGDGYYENLSSPGGDVSYGTHTTQHITSNRKAYAMWWILARIAGWNTSIPVTGLELSTEGDISQVMTGGELLFSVAVLPEDAITQTVVWSVINGSGSATISSEGLLKGGLPGDVEVVALAQDGSGVADTMEITITSASIMVTGISIASDGDVTVLDEGKTLLFTASVLPEDATTQAIVWSVHPGTGTADITQNGLLSALTEGSVEVVASAQDASGISSTFALTINGLSAALKERESSPMRIYPNPSMGKFYLDAGGLALDKIEGFSITGSLVLELVPEPGERVIEVDLSDHNAGAFFIRLLSKDQSSVYRVIISR